MKPVSNETVLRQLQWRHATKKFDATKAISADDWSTLEQTLVLTPSSYGLQPWKFVVITDPVTKAKLLPLSWGQRQVVDASHVVVFAIRQNLSEADIDKYLARIVEVRGGTVEALAGFRRMMVGDLLGGAIDLNHWASLQAYIALGQFMATAAMVGIDTCPMEGIDPARYDEVLGLNELGYGTVVACVAGYRASDDKYASVAKVRFKAEDVVLRIEAQ
ncbi:MAG: NAD(P)H-dependent oxidoreductase [Candidatus Saccharimonas sp.]|nr:NAD(P)H-dependent oxidoreductase [Planctomycetaceae bacterium]